MSDDPLPRSVRYLRACSAAAIGCVAIIGSGCQTVADVVGVDRPEPGTTGCPADEAVIDLEAPPPLPISDLATIELATPTTGQGERPVFSWDPVDGAATYHLTVVAGDGRAYWAWTTVETSVVLGGFDTPPDARVRGPRLTGPMAWHVVARDEVGATIAQSGTRAIAP